MWREQQGRREQHGRQEQHVWRRGWCRAQPGGEELGRWRGQQGCPVQRLGTWQRPKSLCVLGGSGSMTEFPRPAASAAAAHFSQRWRLGAGAEAQGRVWWELCCTCGWPPSCRMDMGEGEVLSSGLCLSSSRDASPLGAPPPTPSHLTASRRPTLTGDWGSGKECGNSSVSPSHSALLS